MPTTSPVALPISARESTAAPAPSSTPPDIAPSDVPAEEPLLDDAPEGFVAIPDPRESNGHHASCAGLDVANMIELPKDESSTMEPFVRVTDASGKKIYEAHGRRYSLDPNDMSKLTMSLVATLCGDLTGDGIPELILTERTLGAHCCYTHYVVSMTRPTKNLLMWEKGDAGTGIWPVRAKPGKAWQLMSSRVSWPPFDTSAGDPALSYSGAPLVPIVFAFEGGQYRARTFRFAEFLRDDRAAKRAACQANPDECQLSELIEWSYGLIIGDWATDKQNVDTDPDTLAALDRRAHAMTLQLQREVGR